MKRCNAYTLTDLLVTTGIIGVLVALPFPVVTSTLKGTLQTGPCMSDMHQLAPALPYLQDNHYTSIADAFWVEDKPVSCWNMMLYPYVNNPSVFSCPAHGLPQNALDWAKPEASSSAFQWAESPIYRKIHYPWSPT